MAKLEDFVRWYSPRDWIENEFVDENGVVVKQASLSPRMQLPDNLWVEVWQQARPIPARRQKRLFDDGKEAEKVRLLNAKSVYFVLFENDFSARFYKNFPY